MAVVTLQKSTMPVELDQTKQIILQEAKYGTDANQTSFWKEKEKPHWNANEMEGGKKHVSLAKVLQSLTKHNVLLVI